MTYATLKRFLWPHTLVPFALIVAIDYVNLIGRVAQILLCSYLVLQMMTFAVGFSVGAIIHFKEDSPYVDLFKYNLVRFFPLIEAGRATFVYLMTEVDAEKAKLEVADE